MKKYLLGLAAFIILVPLFVVAAGTPSITITSPSGGETWTIGETQTITYKGSGVMIVDAFLVDSRGQQLAQQMPLVLGNYLGMDGNILTFTLGFGDSAKVVPGTYKVELKGNKCGEGTCPYVATDTSDSYITIVASPEDPTPAADWKTYSNTQSGYEVRYPKNWKGPISDTNVAFMPAKGQDISLSIHVYNMPPDEAEALLPVFSRPGRTIDSRTTITTNGINWVKLIVAKNQVVQLTYHNGKTYAAQYSTFENVSPQILSTFKFTTPSDQPSISSISPNPATIGSTVTVNGFNLRGFEGDQNLWIENSAGQKGIIYGDSTDSKTVITFKLLGSYCTKDTSYSGLPCPSSITITPGKYHIYARPWSMNTNTVVFNVVAPGSSSQSSLPSTVFKVPELGIQFPIPSDLRDLVYVLADAPDRETDGKTIGKNVLFSSKTLIQADQGTGGHWCTADQGPLGDIHVNALHQISYVHAQATCSDNPSVQDMQTRLSSLLKQAVQSATLMSAPNGKIPPAGYEDTVLTNIETYLNPFPDTDMTQLSGKAAAELYRRAIIGGFPDGQFKGDQPVTRAETAKFLLLARYGSVADVRNSGRFPDVLDGQWYTKFVMTAAQKGIINGHPNGLFNPADKVLTSEFLKMFTLTFGLQKNVPNAYSDVSANAWFAQFAGIANKYNLFPSRSTSLHPGSPLSRQDVAVAIYQFLSSR